jgi:MarR-like DNA-binding transcriptional regulator SgrR of sgrS sRNA
MGFEIKRRRSLLTPGLREQLAEWFKSAGPHETITAQDVATKFGVSVRYARNALAFLHTSGWIERETVWRFRSKTNDQG